MSGWWVVAGVAVGAVVGVVGTAFGVAVWLSALAAAMESKSAVKDDE